MTDNKKVIIITYYWPPSGGGGVQRWYKFAQYLPLYGWHPVVYTPLNPHFQTRDESLADENKKNIQVVKYPIWEPYGFAGIKHNAGVDVSNTNGLKSKISKWVRANILLPDPRVFWVRPSVKYLSELIQREGIKHIITTGPPHSMHLIGMKLKMKLPRIYWIADFRDPMAEFNFYRKLNPTLWAVNRLKKLEKKIVKYASAITGTSPSTCELISDCSFSKYSTITNGWDEEDFMEYKNLSEVGGKYILLHAGSIKSDRVPVQLFETLQKALLSGDIDHRKFELRLIGNMDNKVIEKLNNYPSLNKIVSILPYVTHTELINKHYAEASGLLLLVNDSESSKANIPGKLFEYFALQKPIISFGKKSDDAIQLIANTGLNTYRYDEEIAVGKLLKDIEAVPQVDKMRYTRKYLCKDVADLLHTLNGR